MNVHMTPSGMKKLDVDTASYLARQALANGWAVRHRPGADHFCATRVRGGLQVQVRAQVRDGKLSATRQIVMSASNTTDTVVSWLQEEDE